MNEGVGWRLTTLRMILTAAAVAILARMVYFQVSPQRDIFREQKTIYDGVYREVIPARGQIYDRWGNLLAGNTTVYQVGVELGPYTDAAGIAQALHSVLDLKYNEIFNLASQPASETAVFQVLVDSVTPEEVLAIKAFGQGSAEEETLVASNSLSALVFTPHLTRSYPEHDLASNILGFVGGNDTGYYGVEEQYDELLAGDPQTVWIPEDPDQVEDLPQIPPGASLILTIDREVQAMVEELLSAAVKRNGAASGTIVILDPENGEILAMASTPRIDLNTYWDYLEIISGTTPFNQAVSNAYEPGSVFKVLTMAAALDSGSVDPQTEFVDTGSIEVGGVLIRNWDWGAWGPQDMTGCLQHSLNVCLAWIATEMGPQTFYEYMSGFGFGHTTGVDLAGEVSGRLKLPGDPDWFPSDLGTNSFGQGISVTPLQMLMAISALANEGKMMAPHILLGMIDNGRQFNPTPQFVGQPISAETAALLTDMLSNSLENEASVALVPGYRMAGKTGTAEIPTPYGYTSNRTNTSFVGWGPVEDPQFLVYIWLEKPTSSIWGSEVAAPIFSQLVQRLVVLMDIPPDEIRLGMSGQ